MGVSADFQEGALWHLQTKVAGSMATKRVALLRDELREFNDANVARDRLRCPAARVVKRGQKAPKPNMQGALCRAMAPFTLKDGGGALRSRRPAGPGCVLRGAPPQRVLQGSPCHVSERARHPGWERAQVRSL
eukprot:8943201-Pyramimonas_sp.AAC.1